eukprot:COSAG01_NODE_1586_length_9810_cov_3.655442_4_plen_100_part_00
MWLLVAAALALIPQQLVALQPPAGGGGGAGGARKMPAFSWDTLPVGWHSSNSSGVWAKEQVEVLARYAIITLEKMQGTDLVVPAVRCSAVVCSSSSSAC